jgi:hypothetical protein
MRGSKAQLGQVVKTTLPTKGSAGGAAVVARAGTDTFVASLLVLLGVLALRAAVIFSAQ